MVHLTIAKAEREAVTDAPGYLSNWHSSLILVPNPNNSDFVQVWATIKGKKCSGEVNPSSAKGDGY